jgi:hypothetical protein
MSVTIVPAIAGKLTIKNRVTIALRRIFQAFRAETYQLDANNVLRLTEPAKVAGLVLWL